jgi:hypothetical protein
MAARIAASRRMAVTVEDAIATSGEIASYAIATAPRPRPAPDAESDQADHRRGRPERDRRDEVHG